MIACFVSFESFAQTSLTAIFQQCQKLYLEGDYPGALSVGQKALEVATQQYGEKHIYRAMVLNQLAMIYRKQANYSQAERIYLESIEIQESTYGESGLEISQTLNNLGVLYRELGRFDDAEACYLRALAIREKNLSPNSLELANVYQNLGAFYTATGKPEKATLYYTRATAIRDSAIDATFEDEISSLNSQAISLQSQNRYAEAESLLVFILNRTKSHNGEFHLDIAQPLFNLATFYQSRQKYEDAKKYHRQALSLLEKNFGEYHPRVSAVLNNIALLEIARRRPEAYNPILERKFAIEAHIMRNVFSYASEMDRLAYMGTMTYGFDLLQSAVVQETPHETRTIKMGINATIQRKGLVLDSMADDRRAIIDTDDTELAAVAERHNTISSRLSTMILSGPGTMDAGEFKRMVDALEKEREETEKKLADLSSVYASKKLSEEVDSDHIATLLNGQTALVEFVKFTLYDFNNKMAPSPHYIAYLLLAENNGDPILIDLGDGDVIDKAINEFRREIARAPELIHEKGEAVAEQMLQEKGRILHDLVFLPLSPYVFTKSTLLLCTDSNLNLIPFGVLSDHNDRYLIERYQIDYLSSSRDLQRYETTRIPEGDVVVVAFPDYDSNAGDGAIASAMNVTAVPDSPVTVTRSIDLKSFYWTDLPGTESEAEMIGKNLTDRTVTTFMGKDASEIAIKRLQAPSILHIATHGFFLEDQNFSTVMENTDNRGIKVVGGDKPASQAVESSGNSAGAALENPLLRSGLVFAGANNLGKAGARDDDGILTALEISGLKLWDTDLVVLSACETGLGEVHPGEGVFGLRRAFQLSGARTIVMSMWEVPDTETIELMKNMYDQIKLRRGKSESLHLATLKALYERRETYNAAHPFYWGAFVTVGEP